jgi:(1->4)-alpha-D-glucan 1-alpha-D-glucosylmutase
MTDMSITATYRVQLHEKFTFKDLANILDYLHELGVSTIYASPVTTALKGSQHGYDVTDPLRLNPEIGTEDEWAALGARLRGMEMNWLQDIVPNHMAYTTQNPWLYDVLERGKVSEYHKYFDLQAEPVELIGDRIMAPFLGSTLTECLQKGELSLQFGDEGFVIRYFDIEWPVAVQLYSWICTVTGDCPAALAASLEDLVIASLSPLEAWRAAKAGWLREVGADPLAAASIRRRVLFFNERLNLLETLVGSQHFALTHHRLSSSVINYRRFFTVNSLICLRMEDRQVFDAYHATIRRWYREGFIQGVRVDHIDGLAAPAAYLRRLRAWMGEGGYVVAEKILAWGEALPGGWALEGTTGYEFLAAASQVLTDAGGGRALGEFYGRKVVGLPDYVELVTERKYDFLRKYMGGELDNLFGLLEETPGLGAAGQHAGRLKEALAMLLACWPVYRLYPEGSGGGGCGGGAVSGGDGASASDGASAGDGASASGGVSAGGGVSTADQVTIAAAFDRARQGRPERREELGWLEKLFGFANANPFLSRMMQFTGPLAAKGIEDTSFYVYNPYIAHCEVGDTPAIAGIAAEAFHQVMKDRQRDWPRSLNATTTHDTKRGEDARIRLNLLSASPEQWIEAVGRWREVNKGLVMAADSGDVGPGSGVGTGGERGRRAPSANDEYLIYQALLGGWPEDGVVTDGFRERMTAYLTKALREAKAETTYDDPDAWYEDSCQAFVLALLREGSEFVGDFGGFAALVIREAYAYSLAQALLKLTAPGIPDIYQGAECWETSFVDPDNRRPVDFGHRIGLLKEIKSKEALGAAAVLNYVLEHPERGAMKIFVIYRVLNFRKAHAALFEAGDYIPVAVEGPMLAYLRRHGGDRVLVLVPLISQAAVPVEGFRVLLPIGATGAWTELFTGDVHAVVDGVMEWKGWGRFPVAMLVGVR